MQNTARQLLVSLIVVAAWLEAASLLADWPQANGPHGNFNPRRHGYELLEDLNRAQLVWESEDRDLGYAKGSSSGYVRHLAQREGHPGSCSGVIVADGMALASSFRPTGKVWAENLPHLKHDKNREWISEHGEKLKKNLRIDADDLLLAIDLKTGKTRWKAIEQSKGLNLYMGKREGFGVAPAWHDGRVFSMGTTGRLYAYDAGSGEKLWETNIDVAHERMEAEKQKALDNRTLPGKFGWDASLVIADGVLIVPTYDSAIDMSLRGVNVENGDVLWEQQQACSRYATPAVFHHDDHQYVLVANRRGEMRMIEPRSGKVLWTVTGLAPTYYALSPSATHVFVNVPSAHVNPKKAKDKQPWGLLAAYRIAPEKAELAWTMPDEPPFWFENHMDICAMRRVLIRDGKVYFFGHGHTLDPNYSSRHFSILDEQTGKVLMTTTKLSGSPMMYLVGDRLLYVPDASHSDRLTMQLFTTDPSDFRQLGKTWKPPHTSTTAYEVFMETPYVDGRLYLRTEQGTIRCYEIVSKK